MSSHIPVLKDYAARMLNATCFGLKHAGEGITLFLANEVLTSDDKGKPQRAVLFLSTGAYTDDEISRLKNFCAGMSQDANDSVKSDVIENFDNLTKPKEDES